MLADSYKHYREAFPDSTLSYKLLQRIDTTNTHRSDGRHFCHETAYVLYDHGDRKEYAVVCDCHFTEGIGWSRSQSGVAGKSLSDNVRAANCDIRRWALDRYRLNLRLQYSRQRRNVTPPVGAKLYVMRDTIKWLVEKLENNELVGTSETIEYADSVPSFSTYDVLAVLCYSQTRYGHQELVRQAARMLADADEIMLDDDIIMPPQKH